MTATRDKPLPDVRELGPELLTVSRCRLVWTLLSPFVVAASYFVAAHHDLWVVAVPCIVLLEFVTYGSASHDLVHRNLGLPRRANDLVLRLMEMLCLRSGTAYQLTHLQHHRCFPDREDVEAAVGDHWVSAILHGPTHQFRLWLWAWRNRASYRRALALDAVWFVVVCTVALIEAWHANWILPVYVVLVVAGSWTFPLFTVHIPHDRTGEFPITQTKAFRGTFFRVIGLGHLYHLEHHLYPMVPHHHWRELAVRLDPYLEEAGVAPIRL